MARRLDITPEVAIGEGLSLAVLLGPCVIETRDGTLRLAEALRDAARAAGLPFVFKASFDKANRTSLDSYRGPGLEEGLRVLEAVRREVGVPVTTDVHEPSQAGPVAEVVDLLQVPAFLCRQTDLLVACGATGKPVNLKKGQFLAASDMGPAAAKVGGPVMVTERGTTFGYGDLVADLRNVARLQALGLPTCFDATHSVQRPGAQGTHSGGERHLAPVLARAAVAAGADALFAEVHHEPSRALSDAATQLPLDWIPALLSDLARVAAAVR